MVYALKRLSRFYDIASASANPFRVHPDGYVELLIFYRNAFHVCLFDWEDFETVRAPSWHAKDSGGCLYAQRSLKGSSEYMHTMIMRPAPGLVVDHINGRGLDNRRVNLRVCAHADNMRNSSKKRSRLGVAPSSKYKGVHWCKNRKQWVASIRLSGKTTNVGRFHNEKEAAIAYNHAAAKAYGSFARLNEL